MGRGAGDEAQHSHTGATQEARPEPPATPGPRANESGTPDGQPHSTMRYNRAANRRAHILEQVQASGFVSVSDLVNDLGVSDMTIRRDLRRLSADGTVRVVHGGISLPHATLRTSEFISRAQSSADAKRRIAELAALLVGDGDDVAVDAGTTAFNVVAALPSSFSGTVVTHSVPALQQLLHLPGARVIGIGGELYAPSQALVGPSTAEQVRNLRVSTFFLGAAALDAHGVYVEADIERATKLAMMAAADKVVLVLDGTKFGRTSLVRLCGLNQISTLVSDQPPREAVAAELARHGVLVRVAAP